MNLWRVGVWRSALFLGGLIMLIASVAGAAQPSGAEIDRIIKQPQNRAIIEDFLKYELRDVNDYAVRPLLKQHPSLIFFLNQAERGPMENLIFLEDQIHKLREAQADMTALPYSIVFSSSEKKKLMGLKSRADEIVLRGIPEIKKDFYCILAHALQTAKKRGKDVSALMRDKSFRNTLYKKCEPVPKKLDDEMAYLARGEFLSFQLGWVLETVTLTRLWLVLNDNNLPRPEAYEAYRKKRAEYWSKRLSDIYGLPAPRKSQSGRRVRN